VKDIDITWLATARQKLPTGEGHIVPLDRPTARDITHDLAARAIEGRRKYGTLLRCHNGRDALVDSYQEALDLVMYLRQTVLEGGQGYKFLLTMAEALAVELRRELIATGVAEARAEWEATHIAVTDMDTA